MLKCLVVGNVSSRMFRTAILLFTVCTLQFMSLHAQQTSLTIDNTSPGWLSSKIAYSDQQTVKYLTVTGYLNKEDYSFLGKLINQQSLTETLDLSNSFYVGDRRENDDILPENVFHMNYGGNYRIKKLSLPISVKGANNCLGRYLDVDTLIAGGKMNHIKRGAFSWDDRNSSNYLIRVLILREGVDTIENYSFKLSSASGAIEPRLSSISFPSTLRYIGKDAFYGCSLIQNVILPDSIGYIGEGAFQKTSYSPDTLRLPTCLKQYNTTSFNLAKNQKIYIPKDVESVYNIYRYLTTGNVSAYGDYINSNNAIEFHFDNPYPVIVQYKYFKCLSSCTLFVPKGSSKYYQDEDYIPATYNAWSYAREIIETVPVEQINIEPIEKDIHVGDSWKFQAEILPSDATETGLIWKSSNNEILKIDSDGQAIAMACGSATVTAMTKEGSCISSVDVQIYDRTTGVELEKEKILNVGDSYRLQGRTLPLETSDNKLIWKSSDENVATVDDEGIVTAIKQGKSIITATSVDNKFEAECSLTVRQPATGIKLSKHSAELKIGELLTLECTILPVNSDDKSVTWHSSDENIATVDENGIVTPHNPGAVKISCVVANNTNLSDVCELQVIQPVTGLLLDNHKLILGEIGQQDYLNATILPSNATNKTILWDSSNKDVCVVFANGMIAATGFGTAIISATSQDGGFIDICSVTVSPQTGIVQSPNKGISIKVLNRVLYIFGINERKVIRLISISGQKIYEGYEDRIELIPGAYILRIGTFQTKLLVR